MVLGFVSDKDVEAIMNQMPVDAEYYFATPSVSRGRDSVSTAAIARRAGLEGNSYSSVKDAFEDARASAKDGDTIFVGGSTYVVGDLLATALLR